MARDPRAGVRVQLCPFPFLLLYHFTSLTYFIFLAAKKLVGVAVWQGVMAKEVISKVFAIHLPIFLFVA